MIRDPSNHIRAKLLANPYSFTIKVDTPWQDLPDLEDSNKVPFQRVCLVLNQFERHSPQNPAWFGRLGSLGGGGGSYLAAWHVGLHNKEGQRPGEEQGHRPPPRRKALKKA